MMNKFIKYILTTVLVVGFLASCDKDDFTGDSQLTPSNPEITVTAPATVDAIEAGTVYEFDVTLSEPQIVDVAVHISVLDGTASEGSDFVINNSGGVLVIPAYRTTGKVSLTILSDEVAEDDETFTIQIGDERTANATITPVEVGFTIQNVTEDDLALELSWGAAVFDAEGNELDGDDIADLIAVLTDEDGTVLGAIDGATYESFLLLGTAPDGTYYIKADLYSVLDPGDLGEVPNLDITLDFSQVGKIDHTTYSFGGAFVPEAADCDEALYIVAKIVKSGTDFEVSEVGSYPEAALQPGTYTSTLNPDAAPYWFGIANPQTRDVTVTRLSATTYSISDITSGAYDACCGLPLDQAAVISISLCDNSVTIISETGANVTGQSAKSLGSFDSGTNTFTVYWRDQFGSDSDPDPGALLFSTFVLVP